MKIIRNVPGILKALKALRYLTEYRNNIHKGRETGDREFERENILKATSTWGKKMLEFVDVDLTVVGRENLPTEGPVVYVSNHQGYADIVVLCAALDTIQMGFVAKKELDKVPLYGPWIHEIRSVLIERDNPRESLKAILKGVKNIEEGYSMVIFPEGTRSQGPEMGEFKGGALKLATKPKVPIIPVTIDGTYRCFEQDGYIHGAKVKVMIHPAVPTADLTKEEEKEISDKVQEIVKNGLKELRA